MRKIYLFLSLVITILTGCAPLNPNFMFKTPYGYKFDKLLSDTQEEYKLMPFDELDFNFYTNNGQKLIDIIQPAEEKSGKEGPLHYMIDKDGYLRIPVLGDIYVKGKTIKELQKTLEEKLGALYVNPYVIAKITNKKVFFFPGSGGTGTIITLKHDQTNIIEVLAMAGGIAPTGKAKRIRVIRGDLKNPKIELVNLATMEGIKQSNLFVQPNDIIYVEPTRNIFQGVLTQIAPILSLLTTALLVVQLSKT